MEKIKSIICVGFKVNADGLFQYLHPIHYCDRIILRWHNNWKPVEFDRKLLEFLGKEVSITPVDLYNDEYCQAVTININDDAVNRFIREPVYMTISTENTVGPSYAMYLIANPLNRVTDSPIAELRAWREDHVFTGKCFALVEFEDGVLREIYNN